MFRQAQHDNLENLEFHRSKHQADNLAKLRQEFLSVTKLIAKIFGAVSRTTSQMRLSALLASKQRRCRHDGFCSDEEQRKHTLNGNPNVQVVHELTDKVC